VESGLAEVQDVHKVQGVQGFNGVQKVQIARSQFLRLIRGGEVAVLATLRTGRAVFLANLNGIARALASDMAAIRKYEELHAWQLARDLRDAIFTLTESGPVLKNVKFRDQIRLSSSSSPANIAEGFGRFKPREFAQFMRIARPSLFETRNHLQDGHSKKYFSDEDTARLLKLQVRAAIATTRLLRYLESCKGKAPTGWTT
jgi:four helix bundle protein